MNYSDLPKEKVDSLIDEIKEIKLMTDLVLLEQRLIRDGKINNEAYRYLQKVISERLETRENVSMKK